MLLYYNIIIIIEKLTIKSTNFVPWVHLKSHPSPGHSQRSVTIKEIPRFPSVFYISQQYSTVFNNYPPFSTVFNSVHLCSTMINNVQQFSSFSDSVQHCSTVFNIVKQFSYFCIIDQHCIQQCITVFQIFSSVFNNAQQNSTL